MQNDLKGAMPAANQGENNSRRPFSRPFTFDRVVRLLITIATLFCAVWLIDVLKSVLLPFCVAWLIAYMLEPFVQYNRRLLRVRSRLLPIFMTLFETILILVVICIFFVPAVIDEMHQVAQFIRRYAETSGQIAFIPEAFHDYLKRTIDFKSLSEQMTSQDIQNLFDIAVRFVSGGLDFVLGLFNWFIIVLYVVFIMLDYERLLRGFKRMVPPKYRSGAYRIGNDVKNSMNHYFRGQALVALCVGVLFSIGFVIVGLPLAVVLGLFIGLLNMVPYLQLISIVPTTLLCLVYSADSDVDFWTIWWSCMAVYIVVQCIQDLFLTPKIMGKAMGLNPAIILLSLSVWGTLLGFIGLIIALPLTTLLLAYYNQYIINREDGETPDEHLEDSAALKDMTDSPAD